MNLTVLGHRVPANSPWGRRQLMVHHPEPKAFGKSWAKKINNVFVDSRVDFPCRYKEEHNGELKTNS